MKWADTILFEPPAARRAPAGRLARAGLAASFCASANRPPLNTAGAQGESALSEQLLRQRNETVELQRGILDSLQAARAQVVARSGNGAD